MIKIVPAIMSSNLEEFKKDPDLADLRRDPRYKQLTEEN